MTWEDNYLAHFGIKGQKWGVRRFQNEDGTLTEEGKQRYYNTYDEMEKEADADIARAKAQLDDIAKNGWNAKSAFTKDFVKQLKRENALTEDNLKAFSQVFKKDISDAKLSKQLAQKAKDFIKNSENIYLDNILDDFIDKNDKNDRTKLRDKTLKVSDEMGVETKYDVKMKMPEYTKEDERAFKKHYSEKELIQKRDELKKYIEKDLKGSMYGFLPDKMLINDRPLSSMTLDEQCYYLYLIAINMSK